MFCILTLLLTMVTQGAWAQGSTDPWYSGNTQLQLNEGVLTVIAMANTNGAMSDNLLLDDRAWHDYCGQITRVVVEEGVTTIGKGAFQGFTNLTSVSLPASLKEIHAQAFDGCSSLAAITIPSGVTNVSAGVFSSCNVLAHVYCYANPNKLTWGSSSSDFMQGSEDWPRTTKLHVFSYYLSTYEQFFTGYNLLNATYVGDLMPADSWTDEGNYATEFSSVSGSTITITSEAELARVAYLVNNKSERFKDKKIMLGCDLNMEKHQWIPIGTGDYRYFLGDFDGQNLTISGINVNRSGESNNGLFGVVGSGSVYPIVKNIRLTNSSITGGDNTGGIVGYIRWAQLNNCYTDAIVNGGDYTGGVGGKVAGVDNGAMCTNVTDCLYMGHHVSGSGNTHAVVGGYTEDTGYYVSRCYYTNRGMEGKAEGDVYAVQVSFTKGDGYTITLNNALTCNGITYCATDGSSTFSVSASDAYHTITSVTLNYDEIGTAAGTYNFSAAAESDICYLGVTTETVFEGNGTEASPFLLSNVDDWNRFAQLVSGGTSFNGKFVKVNANISGITTMVGTSQADNKNFQGTFDGGAPTYQLTFDINSTEGYAAPFRYVKNATIKNVKIGGSFSVGNYGTALVGYNGGTLYIENVHVVETATINGEEHCLGGIVGPAGNFNITLKDILFEAALTNNDNNSYTGGIVGWGNNMNLTLNNCTFKGSYTGNGAFHPIAVKDEDVVVNSTVTKTYFYTGPQNINNTNIAAAAIRVQSQAPTDGAYAEATDAAGNKCYYYNDAPQGLSIDYDKERGTTGYYYVNMEHNNQNQQLVLGSDPTSFTVYDENGKRNVLEKESEAKLKLIAPEGKVFEVTGSEHCHDGLVLIISDDTQNLYKYEEWGEHVIINKLTSADNVLNVYYYNPYPTSPEDFFELYITIKDNPNIVLADDADNSTAITNLQGQTVDVILKGRTLYKDGKWNTLCLPFDVTMGSGQMKDATVMTMDASTSGFNASTGELTLNFDEVTSGIIAAGTPFIVKWDKANDYDTNQAAYDVTNPVFSGVTVTSTEGGSVLSTDKNVRFLGTYNPAQIYSADHDNLYLGEENTLYWPSTSDYTLGACRAYFHVNLNGGASAVRQFVLNFGEGETTGIMSIENGKFFDERSGRAERKIENEADTWYDLSGRRLSGKPKAKGVYINNGRKVVIK